jgi:hypothetical protein
MEVWHASNNLWMAFVTRSDGVACIFADGKNMGFADPDINASPVPPEQPDAK